ncbi:MASE1 domain-containing protein [Caballeronia sp. J97]|uniref:MASE1 domain-containing protein n=1 Tax=Caballeronia sp. J97 TaxID=2805429 RepID=UPI002AAF73EF|nr:MASE1 domain-containing protein [Caballeronia sp. J97]
MRRQSGLSGLFWSLPYLLAAYAPTMLCAGHGPGVTASIWLPAGVAMAALMLTRPVGWPAVIAGLVGAQVLFGLLHGLGVVSALDIAILLIVAPTAALALVVRFAQVPLHGLYFLRALFVGALLSSVFASATDITAHSGHVLDFSADMPLRAAAHFVGIFVITPVFTTWARFRPSRQIMHGVAERVIGGIAFAALVPCALLAFDMPAAQGFDGNIVTGLSYAPLVLCVLISLMWDGRGGACSVLVLAIIALTQTLLGHGPFSRTTDETSLIGVQAYLAVASVLVLLTTTLHGSRARALGDAHRWRTSMELALAGSGELIYCLDTKSGRLEWGGDVAAITGQAPEALRTLENVLARISQEDRARVRARWLCAAGGTPVGEISFLLRTQDGGLVSITDVSTPIDDLDDGAAFIAGIWRRAGTPAESRGSADAGEHAGAPA